MGQKGSKGGGIRGKRGTRSTIEEKGGRTGGGSGWKWQLITGVDVNHDFGEGWNIKATELRGVVFLLCVKFEVLLVVLREVT